MAFDESTIQQVLQAAQSEGAPESLLSKLDAELKEVMHSYRIRMDRIQKHSRVLFEVEECGYNVTLAAEKLDMSREGVYKHLRRRPLSTEQPSGVDTKAA